MSPTAYDIRLQSEAREQLEDLDREVGGRILEKIRWLAEHGDQVRHLPLTSDLAGLYKRRVGAYRIIYQVVAEQRILVVHRVGHRRDIYEGG